MTHKHEWKYQDETVKRTGTFWVCHCGARKLVKNKELKSVGWDE